MISIPIKKLNDSAVIPNYAHNGDSGVDLYSIEDIKINPLQRALVHTGISMAIPEGYEATVRPRSGNALKLGWTVLNTPGTIDSNYRGEIGVIVYNSNPEEEIYIHSGDRIAQMVFQKVEKVYFLNVEVNLAETNRGKDGFGSTGR